MTSMTTFIFPFQIEPQECHRQRASASVRGHGRLCGAAREEAKRATTRVKVKRALCGDAIVLRCCRRLVWVWFNLPSCTLSWIRIIIAYNCTRFGSHCTNRHILKFPFRIKSSCPWPSLFHQAAHSRCSSTALCSSATEWGVPVQWKPYKGRSWHS